MMLIDNKFDLGDKVYFKTDPAGDDYMIIALVITPNGIQYTVSKGCNEEFIAYDIELTKELKGVE